MLNRGEVWGGGGADKKCMPSMLLSPCGFFCFKQEARFGNFMELPATLGHKVQCSAVQPNFRLVMLDHML